VKLDLADPFLPRLRLSSPRFAAPVMEVAMREVRVRALGLPPAAAEMPLLYLESLLLQNPGRPFAWYRPPLPGQEHPGLMLSSEVLQLLLLVSKRVGARGWHPPQHLPPPGITPGTSTSSRRGPGALSGFAPNHAFARGSSWALELAVFG
jgi:hypothetical protein